MRTARQSAHEQLYRHATGLVRRQFRDPGLTLTRVATACSVSPRQLQRIFQKAGRGSFREHVDRLRMQEARRLLAAGVPARHIALRIGYSHGSGFAKAFRRQTGAGPSQFRADSGRDATCA